MTKPEVMCVIGLRSEFMAGVGLPDGDFGRSAQIQAALFRPRLRGGAPFDGAVHGPAHLLEPPGRARAELLTPAVGRTFAGRDAVEAEAELAARILDVRLRILDCRFCRSVADVFHILFFLRSQHRTGGWTSIG